MTLLVTAAVGAVALVAILIAMLFETFFHTKGLTIFMWIVAMVPISVTLIMMFVTGYAFYTMFDRRDNIKLTLTLKNKDVFEGAGIKLSPSDDFEWIVAEIKVKKPGMTQAKIKIGISPQKDGGEKIGGQKQDTSQGLLGNLEGVNFDE